jgi:predicted transposase/invertase (TIGR01784 family)
MKEEVMYPQQGNRYDKILKENMESALPVIIKDVLDLDISDSEEIPDDLQQTNERKPDVLKKVRDQHNNTFVLHIEWQSQNEKDMVYRMAEYAVMLQRKYRIPVKQYVLFIGKGGVTMSTSIDYENLKFWYRIFSLKDFDYKFFLKSADPATKVFAILANFEKDGEEKAIETILEEVKTSADGNLKQNQYYNQLRVLVKLRNKNVNLKFNDMISFETLMEDEDYRRNVELDVLYKRGEAKGEARGREEGLEKGLEKGREETQKQTVIKMKELGLATELIAQVINIPIEEIEII